MAKLAVEISKDAKSNLARELTKTQAKVAELEGKLKTTARAGQRAGREMKSAFGPQALTTLTSYMGGVASVGTAVMAVRAHYTGWIKDIKQVGGEARRASNELIALAALQEGGKKAEAVRASMALAVEYGTSDWGTVHDIVQAMQSRFKGSLEKALVAARPIMAAKEVGIPLELGKELEVLGGAQGQPAGQALRRAYVAGQLSEREPETMARVAPALKFWGDKDVGFAAGGALAASVDPERARMQLESAGVALSTLSAKAFQQTIKRLGLAGATQLEQLHGLRAAGIVSPEQLGAAGLKERKQIEALSTVLLKLDDVTDWAKEIKREATPGLFMRERAAIEAELPKTRIERRIRQVEAEYVHELAVGAEAQPAMVEELRARMRGVALRRMGRRYGWLGVPFHEEEGQVYPMDWFRARLGEQLERGGARDVPLGADAGPDRGPIAAAGERIESEIAELLRGAAEELRQAAGQMKGGPTMVPATVDN